MEISNLFKAAIGPDGEIKLVPRDKPEGDPWFNFKRDKCPVCLVQRDKVVKGKLVEKGVPSSRGNVFDLYECPEGHYRWVWDKRYKYWSANELAYVYKKVDMKIYTDNFKKL